MVVGATVVVGTGFVVAVVASVTTAGWVPVVPDSSPAGGVAPSATAERGPEFPLPNEGATRPTSTTIATVAATAIANGRHSDRPRPLGPGPREPGLPGPDW